MKKRLFTFSIIAFFLVGYGGITSCKNDETITKNDKEEKLVDIGEKVQITITTEDYQSEEIMTRAIRLPSQPEIIELDNGLEAEVSIQEDAPESTMTRATTLSDGHYTIYALDSDDKRITGTNKELKGTFTNGEFKPDAGSRMKLEFGTYTFVCINDAMQDNGSYLSYYIDSNPLIGITKATISSDPTHITFLMKHQSTRVRYCIYSYVPIPEGIGGEYKISNTAVYRSLNYDGTPNPAWGASAVQFSLDFPASNVLPAGKQLYSSTTKYLHLLGNDGFFEFKTGMLYGKSLVGKTLRGIASIFKKNGSFTISVKITSPGRYLFNDGSTGELAYKMSRVPIGVVLRKKTKTEQGIAIALRDMRADELHGNWIGHGHGPYLKQNWSASNSSFDDMQGEYWTWNAAATVDGVVAANDTHYGALYDAAHYNPGVATTNIGKWYLPSVGEWKLVYALGGGNPANITNYYVKYPWDGNAADKIFTDAGGTTLLNIPEGASQDYYMSSTEQGQFMYRFHKMPTYVYINIPGGRQGTIRPFVHF